MPIMTSLSTRFLGNPSDTKPTLRIQWEWRLYANLIILAWLVLSCCIWARVLLLGSPASEGGRYKGKREVRAPPLQKGAGPLEGGSYKSDRGKVAATGWSGSARGGRAGETRRKLLRRSGLRRIAR